MRRALLALLVAAVLGGWAVPPPTRPAVIVVPASGKDIARFENEEHFCRRRAYDHVRQTRGPELASNAATTSAILRGPGQQN